MIVRTHVAFGGERLVIVGPDPWRFKKRSQAFSRRLERVTPIVYIPDDDAFFRWCEEESFTPVAIEISENPVYLRRAGRLRTIAPTRSAKPSARKSRIMGRVDLRPLYSCDRQPGYVHR